MADLATRPAARDTRTAPTPPHFPSFAAAPDPRHAYHHAPVAPSATTPGDSAPDADELLRRVRAPRGTLTTCPICQEPYSGSGHTCAPKVDAVLAHATGTAQQWHHEEIDAAYAERDRQFKAEVAAEIAGVAA